MLAQKVFEEPEIYRIEVPFANISTNATNVYVVRDDGDVLLIDMGAPTDEAQAVLEQALDELGISLSEARVFFTHLHFDHSGLASRMLPCATEIYINQHELRSADEEFTQRLSKHAKERFMQEGMSRHEAEVKGALVEIATPLDVISRNISVVNNGMMIQVGRFGFEVIDLPGHTRGMMGLWQPDSGICFTGDQLLFMISPATALFLDDADSFLAYEESMNRLLALPITHLLHSHGPIRADFRERAAQIMGSRAKRIDEAKSIVATNPGICGVDIVRKLTWKIPFSSVDDCGQRQQWLIYTQGISLLDHLALTYQVQRISEPALEGNAAILNAYYV